MTNTRLERYLSYLDQDTNNINLLFSISECYRQKQDKVSAQYYLKQALIVINSAENNPLCLKTELLKANILRHLQQIDDAITCLQSLMLHDANNAAVVGLLALLHFDTDNTEQAEYFASKALSLDPTNYEGLLVTLLLKTLRNEALLTDIESLLAINSTDCRTWFALGTVQLRHMNFSAAETAFLQAIHYSPDFYDAHISLGWCYLFQNNLNATEKTYQQAISMDDAMADAWGGLALVYALKNKLTEANHALEKAQILSTDCFLASMARVMITNQSHPDAANNQLNAAISSIPIQFTC